MFFEDNSMILQICMIAALSFFDGSTMPDVNGSRPLPEPGDMVETTDGALQWLNSHT